MLVVHWGVVLHRVIVRLILGVLLIITHTLVIVLVLRGLLLLLVPTIVVRGKSSLRSRSGLLGGIVVGLRSEALAAHAHRRGRHLVGESSLRLGLE